MRYNKIVMLAVGVLTLGILLGMEINSAISSDDMYESLKKLQNAYSVINQRYVDEVDTASLAEHAIEGMLETMDPHSIYIDADQMRDVNEDFNASFEGIGISYEFVEGEDGADTLAVLNPLPGGPSEKAGLWSGDRIVAVDDSSAIGYSQTDVERTLKGRRGTKVKVTVVRPGYRDPLEFTIVRDKIPLNTVDASYMLDEKTGYVKLQRFARTTYREFTDAVEDLKEEGMDRLVLDLRNNAGGFMDMAIRISDEFIADDKLIVSARSRHSDFNSENRARVRGKLEDTPVIVLVNEQSASASEIVAGALQDHDRGLIVGRRTFGKGLVQKQFPFEDGSVLRMTISRYFTPSGRFIQSPYKDGSREDYYKSKVERNRSEAVLSLQEIIDQVPDSLKYTTSAGRTVIGGGGILPDYIMRRDSISLFVQTVLGKRHDVEFIRQWINQNSDAFHTTWDGRSEDFIQKFEVDDAMFQSFEAFLAENDIQIGGEAPPDSSINHFTRASVDEEMGWMKNLLKARLAVRMFGQSAWYPIRHEYDDALNHAMTLWDSARDLMATNN